MRDILLLLFAVLVMTAGWSQEEGEERPGFKDRDLRLELEPVSPFLKGFTFRVGYNVLKNNSFEVGAYFSSVSVPSWAKPGMFENVPRVADVRLGFEAALDMRYHILFGKRLHNPYVGLIAGWEYFDIRQEGATEDVRLRTWLTTPYVGYEIYLWKNILFVNPQVRGVFYFPSDSSTPATGEKLSMFFLLPAFSVGARL